MVHHDSSQVIAIEDFPFAWRITDPKWTSLPKEVLSRIKPLTAARAKQVFDSSPLRDRVVGGYPFDPCRHHAVAHVSLEGTDDTDRDRVASWLGALPIANNTEVYVCWQADEGVAVITDWKTFSEVWDDLWYPFDSVCVLDDSTDWALLLGPEEHAVFIQSGPVNAQLPKSDPAFGMSLLQPSRGDGSADSQAYGSHTGSR